MEVVLSKSQQTTTTKKKRRVVLAVHGGAGIILRHQLTPEMEKKYRLAMTEAMKAGYAALYNHTTTTNAATDAVEAAVRCMEDCPLFNAGKGSVFAHDGTIRMDASIMSCHLHTQRVDNNDKDKDNEIITSPHQIMMQRRKYPKRPHPQAGSVAGIRNIQNPITLARAVMEHTPHVMLIGEGAEEFARTLSIPSLFFQPDEYFWTKRRWDQLQTVRQKEQIIMNNNYCQDNNNDHHHHHHLSKQQKMMMMVQLDHHHSSAPIINNNNNDDDPHLDNLDQEQSKFGTVGCVALYLPDIHLNNIRDSMMTEGEQPSPSSSSPHDNIHAAQAQLASATSTGGMTNQRHNRVGDSPIIGAGTYANSLCAISCTGHGEWFIRCVAAHDVASRFEYKYYNCDTDDKSPLQTAVEEVVFGTLMDDGENNNGGGDGGLIALDKDGNFAAEMNCAGMYHGWVYEDGQMETRIFWDECELDNVKTQQSSSSTSSSCIQK